MQTWMKLARYVAIAGALVLFAGALPAVAAEEARSGTATGPNPLAFDIDLAVWTGVVFLLLFFVLQRFAWPHIVAALEERERRIAAHMAAAEAQREEAKRVLADHEAKLAAAAAEIRELMEEARRDAEHTRRSIEAKGHEAAKEIEVRALREIERAKNGAIQELAAASANVAIDLARNVVRDQLTPQQQGQLVREALGKLTTATPSEN